MSTSIIDTILKRRHLPMMERAADEAKPLSEADTAKKWVNFTNPSPMLMKINQAYAVLAAILGHTAFAESAGSDIKRNSIMEEQNSPGHMIPKAAKEAKLIPSLADMEPDGVILPISLPELSCFVRGSMAVPQGESAKAFELGRKLLKQLLDLDISNIPLKNGKAVEAIKPRTLPIEVLAKINVPGVGPLDMDGWNKEYQGLVSFTLQPYDLAVRDSSIATNISDHADFNFIVGVTVKIKFPREYALWSTGSTETTFSPLLLWLQFQRRRDYYGTIEPTTKKPPAVTKNPSAMDSIAEEAAAKYALIPRRKTNSDGICSLPSGELIWVPDTEINVAGAMNECLSPATDNKEELRKIDISALQDRHVGTSWIVDKMVMTDAAGNFHLIDLTGARIPSQEALAHLMKSHIGTMLQPMVALAESIGVPIDMRRLASAGFGYDDIAEQGVNWEHLIDVPFTRTTDSDDDNELTDEDKQTDLTNSLFFQLGKDLAEAYVRLVSSNVSAYQQYQIRPYFTLLGPYAKNKKAMDDALTTQLALNRAHVDSETPPPLHDLTGVDGLMPHQVRVTNELSTNPTGAILDVKAGGGKSLGLMHDVTDLMYKGKIQRPVVVMPSNLLGPFSRELIRFTKGHFRPFILNSKTWGNLTYSFQLAIDPKAVIDLMRRQPRNTIFLVDYGWLALQSIEVPVMGESETFYPHAAILAAINPDYVAADESQRAKTLGSGRSKAVSTLFAIAKYRRISSGTILHNTARDYIGQMALIEPLALGNVGELIKLDDKVSLDDTPEMRHNIDSFARRIKVPRREWAHLLPEIVERVHMVHMTKAQKKFNNQIMDKALAALQEDPKLTKLKKLDPDKAQKGIESLFKRYFAKVEIWLNAPDSTRNGGYGNAFAELEGVGPEDLKSPKVDVIDDLIDQHFAGGQFKIGDDMADVAPDPNKIIVACYNKAATEHIFKHSRHANKGVFFEAGDDLALNKFKSDKPGSPIILYCNENSISEGHNLQCFPGSTPVLTDYNKAVAIETIYNDPNIKHVLSYDLKKRKIERKRIVSKMRHKVKPTDKYVMVSFKDNETGASSYTIVTAEHRYITKDRREVFAGDLKKCEQLITYSGDWELYKLVDGDYLNKVDAEKHRKSNATRKQWLNPANYDKVQSKRSVTVADTQWKNFQSKQVKEGMLKSGAAAKISKSKTEHWKDPEYRAYVMHDYFISPAFDEFVESYHNSPEQTAIRSERSLKLWSDPKHRQNMSEKASARWADPEYKKQVGDAISEALLEEGMHEILSANSKRMWDKNYDRLCAAITKGLNKSEVRAVLSAKSTEMWKDPNFRRLTICNMRKALASPEARETKRLRSKEMWAKRPVAERDRIMSALIKGQGVFPNRPEKAVIDLGVDNLKYTGDGSYWVTIDLNGTQIRKNPDFIRTTQNIIDSKGRLRTNKVVEIIGARAYTGRTGDYDNTLKKAYKKAGIDCMIIDAEFATKKPNITRKMIESHINNHYLTVTKISPISVDDPRVGKYKYDIEVEDNENFFAVGDTWGRVEERTPVLVHNCASRLIRLQSLWTPGQQEQMQARVWRPDVPDKDGNIKYPRQYIWIDWIIISPSVEVPKMARLIGKQVENLCVEESDSSPSLAKIIAENKRTFDGISRIRMSLDFIREEGLEHGETDTEGNATHKIPEMLRNCFAAYSLTKDWERKEFAVARKALRAKIVERTGKTVKNADLAAASMVPVTSASTNEFEPGDALQAQGYLPWTEGFNGYNPTNLKLQPLTMPDWNAEEADETDDAEETEEIDENVHVEPGDPVATEFGLGTVTAARTRGRYVSVLVPGFQPEPVRLWRYAVLGATTDIDREALRVLLNNAGKNGTPTLRFESKNQTLTTLNNKIPASSVNVALTSMTRAAGLGKLPARPDFKNKRGITVEDIIVKPALRQRAGPRLPMDDDEDDMIPLVRDARDAAQPARPDTQTRDAQNKALDNGKTPRGISRAPGLDLDDPVIKLPPKIQPAPKVLPPGKKPAATTLDMRTVDEDDLWSDRQGEAILFNGAVCILTPTGGQSDKQLLQNGFVRIGKSVRIQVKNPQGYRDLVAYLAKKFFIPRPNKRALDQFADIYEENRKNVAFMDPNELQFHAVWLKDQRKHATEKNEIRPWPVVEDGKVYLYINLELCPAVNKLKGAVLPMGTYPPKGTGAALVAMVRNTKEARTLLKELKGMKIRFADEALLLDDLKSIRNA